jgi:hypothetical protein
MVRKIKERDPKILKSQALRWILSLSSKALTIFGSYSHHRIPFRRSHPRGEGGDEVITVVCT